MMAASSSSVAGGCTCEMNIDAAFDSLTAECSRAYVVAHHRDYSAPFRLFGKLRDTNRLICFHVRGQVLGFVRSLACT